MAVARGGMKSGVTVRPMVEEDLREVGLRWNGAGGAGEIADLFIEFRYLCFTAVVKKRPAGFIMARLVGDGACAVAAMSAFGTRNDDAVLAMLIDRLGGELRDRGMKVLYSEILPGDDTGLGIYERLGFRPAGEFRRVGREL